MDTETATAGSTAAAMLPPRPELEGWVRHLAAIERPSASDGERQAAEWIAERLREFGCDARVERETAHGGYWWPLGLLNAASAIAALVARRTRRPRDRRAAALVGAAAAALIWDDVGHGARWHRRLLPRRPTFNVVAETGDPDASRTVVLIAHHDAAHTGAIFNPAISQMLVKLFPNQHARADRGPPIMLATWLGPVIAGLGGLTRSRSLLGLGSLLGAGAVATLADIGARGVVPAANDNLSAVATILAVARSLQQQPLEGVRVLLLSTGSEESFSEGMQAFGRRHFDSLPRESTEMICLECVGSPHLHVIEGEGMIKMRKYPERMREEIARAATESGVQIARGLHTTAATDAIIALRAGYQVATIVSVDESKWPANYHWSSDVPDNLSWDTIEQAIRVCDRFVRSRAR